MVIELPGDMEARVEAMAKAAGRTVASYARDVILEHLEDLEDIRIAEERLADIRAGRSTTISLDQMMRRYGLSDFS